MQLHYSFTYNGLYVIRILSNFIYLFIGIFIQALNLLSEDINMANLANYSPYNKTYKFILFQNQAYHQKNKREAMPCVKTNVRYARYRKSEGHTNNPQCPDFLKNIQQNTSQCLSPVSINKHNKSAVFDSKVSSFSPYKQMRKSAIIDKEKKVIHKHASFQKFRNKAIAKNNSQLVDRLISTSCHVVKKQTTEQSFQKHLKYRNIRKLYHEHGKRKHSLALGKTDLLCPTLSQFNKSGLGPKFLEKDLSMCSARSATANSSLLMSPRKKTTNLLDMSSPA